MSHKTALYEQHLQANAKMVDFSGWEMPLHYGSQIDEHHKVRQHAGVFDVSHMGVVDIKGPEANSFLRYLLANDINKLKLAGKALYTCMLNEEGGIIDDLIVYFIEPEHYRIVVNAGTREKDIAWIKKQAQAFQVQVITHTDLAILAIQGPNARQLVNEILSPAQQAAVTDLKPFQGVASEQFWIARTGYTGEDGYEIILPNTHVIDFWKKLLTMDIAPCGLGARDTLRLEAGLNLYGTDMDETITPFESNLDWTVAFDDSTREFIGAKALQKQKEQGIKRALIGLVLDERGVLRGHQKVKISTTDEGEITSGSFSPTLGKAIAFARIPTVDITTCLVEIRGKWLPARIVKPPFVRNGQSLI
jgi:aminomethyltransferase